MNPEHQDVIAIEAIEAACERLGVGCRIGVGDMFMRDGMIVTPLTPVYDLNFRALRQMRHSLCLAAASMVYFIWTAFMKSDEAAWAPLAISCFSNLTFAMAMCYEPPTMAELHGSVIEEMLLRGLDAHDIGGSKVRVIQS